MPHEILIYDFIGKITFWDGSSEGYDEKDMVEALAEVPDNETQVEVRINSPGGLCGSGFTIQNYMRSFARKRRAMGQENFQITSIVDGYAFSAASIITLGGDKVVMNRGALMMIHCAATLFYGTAKDLRKEIEILDKLDDNIANLYADKAKGKKGTFYDLMLEETYLNSKEAVKLGLADVEGEEEVETNKEVKNLITNFQAKKGSYAAWLNARLHKGDKRPSSDASGASHDDWTVQSRLDEMWLDQLAL